MRDGAWLLQDRIERWFTRGEDLGMGYYMRGLRVHGYYRRGLMGAWLLQERIEGAWLLQKRIEGA